MITQKNLGDLGFGNEFSDTTQLTLTMNRKIHKLEFIKIKNSVLQKTLLRELEDRSLTIRRYFQNTEDWYEMIHGK